MQFLGKFAVALLVLSFLMAVLFAEAIPQPFVGVPLLALSLGAGVAISAFASRFARQLNLGTRPPLWMRLGIWFASWAACAGLLFLVAGLVPGVFVFVKGFASALVLTLLPMITQLDADWGWLRPRR